MSQEVDMPQPSQGPNENPIVFLESLKEALQKFTNLDLDSYEDRQF